jgi:DNA polymerase V
MTVTAPSLKNTNVQIFLYQDAISCGFPSPAEDFIDKPLDLNDHLIAKPEATYFVRAQGESMVGVGIHDGDLLIVDRSLEARSNHIVVAALNGELTLKRLVKRGDCLFLMSENPKYPPLQVTQECDFHLWGVAMKCQKRREKRRKSFSIGSSAI